MKTSRLLQYNHSQGCFNKQALKRMVGTKDMKRVAAGRPFAIVRPISMSTGQPFTLSISKGPLRITGRR